MQALLLGQVPGAAAPQGNNAPYNPDDIINALNGLVVAVNQSVVIGQQLTALDATLQDRVARTNTLLEAQQVVAQLVAQQQGIVAGYQGVNDQNNQVLERQRATGAEFIEQRDHLQDALNGQGVAINALLREFEEMSTDELNAHFEELLRQPEMVQYLEIGSLNPKDVKANREIAIIASLVGLAASTCLVVIAPPVGLAGVSSLLPGFKYARQAKAQGFKAFRFKEFAKHIAVGGTVHLATSLVVGPALSALGEKIATANAIAGIGAANVVDKLLVEALGKTISQAVVNTTSILLRKKLMNQPLSRKEIFYSVVAGSFGAAASFGVDKYADQVSETVARIFVKGIAGFVNSGSTVWMDNLCHNRKWSENLFQEGVEGFFWSVVFQTADEIRQYRFRKAEFEKIKKDILAEVEKLNIPEAAKKALKEAINKTNTLEEINAVLNEAKRNALIEEINQKDLPPENKNQLIEDIRRKDLGLHEIIKNVYTNQIQRAVLPKELKDKLCDSIAKAQNPGEIKAAIDNALKSIQDEIALGHAEGKTWNEVRDQVKDWVKDLVERGYHPTGDHLPQHMWDDPIGLDILVNRIMKQIETGNRKDILIFTHHEHRVHMEIVGTKLVKYRYDNRTLRNIQRGRLAGLKQKHIEGEKDLKRDVVKPRDLKPLRDNFNNLKSAADLCEHVLEILQHAHKTSITAANKEVQDKVKDATLKDLTPEQMQKMYTALLQKIKDAKPGTPPAKFNFFRTPWIALPQHRPGQAQAQASRPPAAVNPNAIRAPAFQPRPVASITAVAGFQPIQAPVIVPIVLQPAVPPPVQPPAPPPEPIVPKDPVAERLVNQIQHSPSGKGGRRKKINLNDQLQMREDRKNNVKNKKWM